MQLTPEEVATLKSLAAAAPALEALLGAPAPRTDETDDAWLRRKIAGDGDHLSNLQARVGHAWRK